MISCFIIDNMRRWEAIDSRTMVRPLPLDPTTLKNIKREKYSKWDIALSAEIPGTGKTYRKFVDEQPLDFCTIKKFFMAFEGLFDEEKHPVGYKDILQDLKVGLDQCGASCPCPAGMRD